MSEVGEGKKQELAGRSSLLYRDVSSCNTYNYGDAFYWDSRYTHEVGSFDWYQRYSALRPFVQKYVPTSARVLMVGCGNAGIFLSSVLALCFFDWMCDDEVVMELFLFLIV